MAAEEHRRADLDLERDVRAALGPLELEGLLLDVRDGTVYLEGTVLGERERREAERLARRVPGVRGVVNQLTVTSPGLENLPDAEMVDPLVEADREIEGIWRFGGTERSLNRDLGADDPQKSADEAEPYFPPTDPVVRVTPRELEGIEITGGFAPTSLDHPGFEGDVDVIEGPGDAEIADDVRIALREDAATADLQIIVYVRNGVVHLRGVVPTLADAELAESVASQVPGIVEVREELEIAGLADGGGERR